MEHHLDRPANCQPRPDQSAGLILHPVYNSEVCSLGRLRYRQLKRGAKGG
jgi:hypothetical protein